MESPFIPYEHEIAALKRKLDAATNQLQKPRDIRDMPVGAEMVCFDPAADEHAHITALRIEFAAVFQLVSDLGAQYPNTLAQNFFGRAVALLLRAFDSSLDAVNAGLPDDQS